MPCGHEHSKKAAARLHLQNSHSVDGKPARGMRNGVEAILLPTTIDVCSAHFQWQLMTSVAAAIRAHAYSVST